MLVWVLSAVGAPLVYAAHTGGGLGFRLESSAGVVEGQADVFTATLDLTAGTGAVVVDATSLATGYGPRDQRMLVFALDVATFPELRFDVQRVVRGGEGEEGPITLHGTLLLHGVAMPLSVPALVSREGDNLRLRGEVPLVLADHGIPDPSVLVARVSPTVLVTFDLLGAPSP